MVSMVARISKGPSRTGVRYGTAHIPDVLSGSRRGRHECSLRLDVLGGGQPTFSNSD
ncbi:hypothetical protein GCM10010251_66980 [Streptomyces aurantiogriseus]|uniref:Uncharacterized protein n=1 Tax=Streptomyces aurantiogriseus TaxID=66870 RepID=A0A918FIV7_9ACTN|nr:hypothetical protein GCM10010251_66980 [Streptomyces aurantiogriseus]